MGFCDALQSEKISQDSMYIMFKTQFVEIANNWKGCFFQRVEASN